MNYPLITEYIEAIKDAGESFDELRHLRPVLGDDGAPMMSSGNFAVVFKMEDPGSGKLYAVKCFTREQEGRDEAYRLITDELAKVDSPYLTPIRFLERELFVDSRQTTETEFPVLLMDWVEGRTLDRYLRDIIADQYEREMLAYRFSQLAQWLMPQPFAHGDLKPDNILVRYDGSLVLVDYDGMFVPAMQGQQARELGSPDFRHPARTAADFNEHIDDFALVTMLLSLKAIAVDPALLDQYGAADRILLSAADYRDIASCQLIKAIFPSQDNELNDIVWQFVRMAADSTTRPLASSLALAEPPEEILSTVVTKEDLANAWTDKYSALYSPNGLRLLKGVNLELYHIRQGTRVICDGAFISCERLSSITIPDPVTHIGDHAFSRCKSLYSITIPDSVTHIGDNAFFRCERLSSITIPDSVIHIGKNPFADSGVCRIECKSPLFESDERALYTKNKKTIISFFNKDASNFIIPNSVTHIGDSAFRYCNSLSSIIIPDSVTHIGDYAFYGCHSLSSITIPDSVTHIGKDAFYCCFRLSSITIPDSLTHIDRSAFFGCERLSSITIPDSVTHIDDWAFSCCFRLSSITIPDSVTHIGDCAFYECENLSSISIPDSVTHIGDTAFLGCKKLSSITIPSSVTAIGRDAFGECVSLKSIIVPYGEVERFKEMLEPDYHDLIVEDKPSTEVTEEDLANAWTDEYGALYSPDGLRLLKGVNLEQYHIRQETKIICDKAFLWCDSLFSITIPDSVTHIGYMAFYACKKLFSITIPDSVTHIGERAFEECERLSSITLPDSVTHIGDGAFTDCCCLSSISIPNTVTYIGDYAFSCCKSLSSITIPDAVTHIGNYAFMCCDGLSYIIIPSSVTHIGDGTFFRCENLSSVTLPDSMNHIGDSAFLGCKKLSLITIPDSVTHIGDLAFDGCQNLSSITIPNSVTHIGKNPFADSSVCRIECKSLFFEADRQALYTKSKKAIISFFNKSASNYIIPDSVTHIGDYAFYRCENLSSISIPDSVTYIGDRAFDGCESLSSITIPNSVTHIGYGAFTDCCRLSTISIPNTVTHIDDHVFTRCKSLSSITIPDSVTHIGNYAFVACKRLSSIIIPRGSRAKFEQMLPKELHDILKEQ